VKNVVKAPPASKPSNYLILKPEINPKSWRSERGQFARIEIERKTSVDRTEWTELTLSESRLNRQVDLFPRLYAKSNPQLRKSLSYRKASFMQRANIIRWVVAGIIAAALLWAHGRLHIDNLGDDMSGYLSRQ
jgi:hypothetical protein